MPLYQRRIELGAGEEVRTLDIYLGKVVLYQLSYTRIVLLILLCYLVENTGIEPVVP